MTKNEIFEYVNSKSFLKNYCESFVFILDSALVLHDIKEATSSIEVSCDIVLFNALLKMGAIEIFSETGFKKLSYNNIVFYLDWPVKEYVYINEFKVASVLSVYNDKITLSDELDYMEMMNISKYIEETDKKCEHISVYSAPNFLRGMMHNGGKDRLVLIVHGYLSSNKIGPHRLYYQIADEISKLGNCVVRIDLSGMGESDGDIKDIKFNNHLLDLYIIINNLLKVYSFEKIDLIGHCSGCSLILNVLKYYNNIVGKVIMISPYIFSEDTIGDLLDKNSYEEMKNKGYTYRKGLYCDSSFINNYNIMNNSELINILKEKEYLVLFSENDEICNISVSKSWGDKNRISYLIIKSANHNYLGISSRKELLKIIRCMYS